MSIGALIPMRLLSERLPGKALIDLCGRPACFHLFDRVIACKHITNKKQVVVCTTQDPSDDPLVDAVTQYGCSVFRGAKDDIIARFGGAMESFGFDHAVQADGDDPLSATEYMDITMDSLLINSSTDIVTVEGLPLGCATKSFSRVGMKKVLGFYRTEKNDTGFIYYFTKTGMCEHKIIRCNDPDHMHKTARLTLDYEVDLELFEEIFGYFKGNTKPPSLKEVVAFLRANSDISEINAQVKREYWERTKEKAALEFLDERKIVKKILV